MRSLNLALVNLLLASLTATAQTAIPNQQQFPPGTEQKIAARRAQLVEWSTQAAFNSDYKYGPFDILAATLRNGCGSLAQSQYMANLGKMGLNGEPFEMFALTPLVRYLYMYPECMTDGQRKELLSALTAGHRDFTAHGTQNHMVLQETSWYLLAQYFPDAAWTDRAGTRLTSAAVMARIKDLLIRRDWRSFQSGMNEMFSPTYAYTNVYPLLNMIDYARDKDLAGMASDEASLEILALKANSFHGVIMPPLFRHNVDQMNAPLLKDWPVFAAIAQQMLWYYFGEPQIGPYDLANRVREPVFAIMLALSRWRPPAAAWFMPTENYRIRTVIPDFTHFDDPTFPVAYGDTWIGRDYAIATGNMVFDPRRYNDHDQTFALAFRSTERRNLLECQQPYWLSNSGEDAWGSDLWSPFLQAWRLDNQSAVLLASIPKEDPWTKDVEERFWTERDQHKDSLLQLVQCRIPKAVDELVVENKWAFFRKGTVYVAVGSLYGSFEQVKQGLPSMVASDFVVLKVRQPKTALYVMVDDNGGTFEDFRARAKASAPAFSEEEPAITSGSTTVRYVSPFPDPAHAGYWRSLPQVTVNGNVVVYKDSPVIETPFLQLSSGVLQVSGVAWSGGTWRVSGPAPLQIHGPERPVGPRNTY